MKLEVIAFDLEGVKVATAAGADRIELCSGPQWGGLTPDKEVLNQARALTDLPIHVMVRPRPGNFVYTTAELNEMISTIEELGNLGYQGVVMGCLDSNDKIDERANQLLISAAQGMVCNFHRAFDSVFFPFEATEKIIDLGFERLLTSGLEDSALEGASLIGRLIEEYRDEITIMPGAGITSGNIMELHDQVHASEYHTSAKIVNEDGTYIGVNPQEVKGIKKALLG